MPSVRFIARRLADRAFGTAFDRAVERAKDDSRTRFLFFWNRGLGDIALGLVPLFLRLRDEIHGARIEVITREELRTAFELAGVDKLYVVPNLVREALIDIDAASESLGFELADFAAVFDYPDPNRWLVGQRRRYPPRLAWIARWDSLVDRFRAVGRDGPVIGAHVDSETAGFYGYVKDWPAEKWQQLLARFPAECQWVLFGNAPSSALSGENVLDLRGRTSFPELMSIIRNRCRVLVAPDSGVLTMAYYLDAPFEIEVISLWSDPRQGILLQGCASPNPRLRHTALQSPGEDIRRLEVETVGAEVARALRAGT
jgi:ADP-heptose:LPS heptosyltransferase